jgi:hypothetical protein
MRAQAVPRCAGWLATCCSVAALHAQPAANGSDATLPALRRDDANLVLLEVRLDDDVLSDSLTSWRQGADMLLPLGELARLLTLSIRVLPEQARAEGYIVSDDRTFFLDAARGVVILGGRSEPYDRARVRVLPDDIYVAASLLASWLPVELDVNLSTQTLGVRPRELLPLQARLQRERLAGGGARRRSETPAFPLQSHPYALLAVPFVDQSFTLGATRGRGHQTSADYSAFIAGDFAATEASVYVASSRDKPNPDIRFSLGRHDPGAGLLGGLGARSILFGSGVSAPGVTHVAARTAIGGGQGLVVSNRPLSQPTKFDRHTLEGDLPPGWDVELYYNDGLVGFQTSRPDGRFRFEDQPLAYGTNEFRLVFHGPLGQQRVERQVFVLEQSAVPPGELYYTLGTHGGSKEGTRTVSEFEWGLNRQLSLDAGLEHLPPLPGASLGRGEGGMYFHAGVRGYWAPFIFSNEVYRSPGGGLLGETVLKSRLGPVAIGYSHLQSRGFECEVFLPSIDPMRLRDTLRLDGFVPALAPLPRLPYTLEVLREVSVAGRTLRGVGGRISAYVRGTTLSNQIAWQSVDGLPTASGTFQVSHRIGNTGLSGQLGYTLRPQARLDAAAVALDRRLPNGYLVNLGLVRSLGGGETIGTASLTRDFGSFGLGVSTSLSSKGIYSAGLRLFIAMGRDPRTGTWRFDALPRADSGTASVRVFLDRNGNGVFDEGDEPLENASLQVNGSHTTTRTDARGLAWLDRLPVHQGVDVAVDVQLLDDPSWQPLLPGVRIVPRPGTAVPLEFAVVSTSEIEGTVYLQDGKTRTGIGNANLELMDLQRRVVATTRSSSDGYYVFTGVRGGNYLVRIAAAQLAELGLADPGLRAVTAQASGDIVGGNDFVLVKP